ncbi:putative quinol monooxygenase [Deinococcus sp.]|uniref:putative quinol monooxygenase n=1 Tax=Deinococcus sp. TaxID=47478 RepID=UPI003B5A34D6
MYLSHGTLTAPDAHADDIRQLLQQIAAATRQEQGCLLYLVSEQLDSPGQFIITEQWASMDDMQTHLAQPAVGEAVAAVHGMGVNDLTITAWEAGQATKVM